MHSQKPEVVYDIIESESCEYMKPVVIEVADGATVTAYALEIFARVINGLIRPGWAVIGNEFLFSDDAPWRVRWDGLKGTAEEKLAAFDPKLAAELKRRKITLDAAKKILLKRDVYPVETDIAMSNCRNVVSVNTVWIRGYPRFGVRCPGIAYVSAGRIRDFIQESVGRIV